MSHTQKIAVMIFGFAFWAPAHAQSQDAATRKLLSLQQAQIQALSQELKELRKASTPSEWQTLNLPAGWEGKAQCRRNGEWIEFKGTLFHPAIVGWCALSFVFLPEPCRPRSNRPTEMPCHGENGVAQVCNNDFYTNGTITICTRSPATQQRFDGFRIWGAD